MTDILDFIFKNQITAESWEDIQTGVSAIISDHDKLIRYMAQYVLDDKAGGGDERRNLLGIYYDEVQKYVTWVINTANEVWDGKWGNGDARIQKFLDAGFTMADYEMVQARVKATVDEHTNISIPDGLKPTKDMGGKRYLLPNVPTKKGVVTWKGYPQAAQGENPYVFTGSGCGFMSFYSAISTIKGYNMTPLEYANKNLKAVGGTKCPISTAIGQRLLDREGIKYERVKSFTTDELVKILREHLSKGCPAVVALTRCNRAGVNHKGRYANSEHYALLIGVTADGKKAYLMDSSRDTARPPRYVDLWDICDHIPTAREREDLDPRGLWNGWVNCGGVVLIDM
jgi:hypothetical protein